MDDKDKEFVLLCDESVVLLGEFELGFRARRTTSTTLSMADVLVDFGKTFDSEDVLD